MKLQANYLLIGLFLLIYNFGNAHYFSLTNKLETYQTIDFNLISSSKQHFISNDKNAGSSLLINNQIKPFISSSSLESGIQNNTNLSFDKENSYKNRFGFTFGKGILFGFMLTLVLLNLTSYILFNEKLFIYFSGVVATFASIFWLFDLSVGIHDVTTQAFAIQSISIIGFGIIMSIFAYNYLSLKKYYPAIKTPSIIALSTASLLLLLGFTLENLFLINLANTVVFALIGIYFMAGTVIFSRKNYAKFFVIASAIPFLFMIDFFAFQPFGINFLGVTMIHIEVAVVIEILILTYAIVYRMNAVTEEIEIKKTEMKIFLKQQDSLVRSNVERMVEDVYLENLIMHYDLDGIEVKLLQYISEGKSNKKIARKLKLSDTEVKEFTQKLYEKLEINEKVLEDYNLVDSQPDYIYN